MKTGKNQFLTHCLACGSNKLTEILDLGTQPLANSFLKKEEFETECEYPLKVNTCEKCFHTQLSFAVDPDLMFKNYLYVSGTSQTLKDYMQWFSDFAYDTYGMYSKKYMPRRPTFLDIACNDGTQLDAAERTGFSTYGLDPAENLYEVTKYRHNIHCGYLDANSTYKLLGKSRTGFDVINAQNVFAHNSDPHKFLVYCASLLEEDGVLFIQNSQADMIKNGEFDTIYHEHISFWNANSIDHCARRAGLVMVDRIRVPVHGISDLFVFRAKKNAELENPRRLNILAMEKQSGLHDMKTYREFGDKARYIIKTGQQYQEIGDMDAPHDPNRPVVAIGAAAKGMTFLNASGLKPDYIIDENPLKIGLYSPGIHAPIVGMDFLKEGQEYDFIILAWNFKEEIVKKLKTKKLGECIVTTFMPKNETKFL